MRILKKAEREKLGREIFDGLRGKGMLDRLEIPTAVMVVMVAMMWADEKKDEVETRQIRAIGDWSPIFASLAGTQVEKLIDEADAIVHELGDEAACKKAAASLPKPLRLTAFAFAAMVLFADNKVVSAEMDEAVKLAGWLQIERPQVEEILRVVSIMRHDRDMAS